MIGSRNRTVCLMILLAVSLVARAQVIPSPPSKPATSSAPVDPLGRDTPSGTIFGFLQTAQQGNYKAASEYLKLTPSRRQAEGADLALKLKTVMDRAFVGSLRSISNQPDGAIDPGIPPDHQRIGTLSAGDAEVDLMLVRVPDPASGKIWLVAQETLDKVPEVYEQLQARQVEKSLPQWLVRNLFLGMPLWQWLAMLVGIPVAGLVAKVLIELGTLPRRLWARYRGQPQLKLSSTISGPLWLVMGTVLHRIIVSYLRIPLLHRHYYFQVAAVVFIVAVTWLALRMATRIMRSLRDRAVVSGRTGTGSLILLGQRMIKVAILIVATLAVLGSLGFNLTTALTGLGIGGIAIAFAAQKTLENLFGGISLLGDEVIRVGDVCKIGDRVGTVEDISLRSTRLRTAERSELSIPNGSLATMNLENLSRRDKILFTTKIGLRPETTAEHLRYVLAEIRRLLYEHPKVEVNSARVRLVELGESSLNLELFCYILTTDHNEFTAVREDLYLRIMEAVESSGTDFASPSRVYVARDTGLHKEKTDAATQKVQEWRDNKQLPFPDFSPSDISSFRGSIPYPHPDSAVGNNRPK
jgi:MscS family membrane protein